jgi:hypothetical protein
MMISKRIKLRQFSIFMLSLAAIVSAFSFASAQEQGKSEKKAGASKDRKSTTINFEDQLVEGQAQKPELFYLLQKKQFNYKRLIRLRDDFLPEMRKAAEDIQRKGSGN